MKIPPILLLSCFLSLPTNAATSLNDCTVESSISKESFSIIQEEAEIFKVSTPLLQQMLDLAHNSLIETMSAEDIIKYTEIRSKLSFTSSQQYIISEHERDIEAIATLWKISYNKINKLPVIITQYSNGVLLEKLLGAITYKLKDQFVNVTDQRSSSYCTVSMALTNAQIRLIQIKSLQDKSVSSALIWILSLLNKHTEMKGVINYSILTIDEQTQYKRLMSDVIQPERDRETVIKQAEFFKIMLALSAERASDGLADLVRSGGDSAAVGRTFKGRPRDTVSEMLVGALYYIGDNIPSRAEVLAQGIGAAPPAIK